MIRKAAPAAALAIVASMLAPPGAGAETFPVTRTGDGAVGDCDAQCTLREAIEAANASAGPDRIRLGRETYRLTVQGVGEEDNATGDLDVTGVTTILGKGASRTEIRGAWSNSPDRLIDLFPGGGLVVRGLTLRGGEAPEGSAIDAEEGTTLEMSSVVVRNSRSEYTAVENSGDAVLRRVLFTRNVASGCCAAFYNTGANANVVMTDVVFDRNRATDDTGAFYSSGDSALLRRVTFSENHAGTVGGAMITSSGTHVLRNVTFSGNTADEDGGALYLHTEATVNNSTFYKNVADLDADEASSYGGAIGDGGGTAILSNSIVAGNRDGGGGQSQCSGGSLASDGFNLFGSGGCVFLTGPGDIALGSGSPGLKRLAPNGGFARSHALKPSSPARNKGQNSSCEPHDQRRVKRPQGPRCDIGAYELKRKRRR